MTAPLMYINRPINYCLKGCLHGNPKEKFLGDATCLQVSFLKSRVSRAHYRGGLNGYSANTPSNIIYRFAKKVGIQPTFFNYNFLSP